MCARVRVCVCVCVRACVFCFVFCVCLFVVLEKGSRCGFVLVFSFLVFFLTDTFTRNFKTSSQLMIRTEEKTGCF